MRDVEIKLTGRFGLDETVVAIDGTPADFKRQSSGGAVCDYHTENDRINIKLYRMLDVGGALWFIVRLVFFVISIFGIFDIHRKERCLVIDFDAEIDLKECDNKITLQVNIPQENEKAVDVQTDLACRESANKYFTDTKAKKVLKALKWAKLLLAGAIIATVITVLAVAL